MKKGIFAVIFFVISFPSFASFELYVLGVAQDGGRPHTGCMKACCTNVKKRDYVVSLALADPVSKKWWLFEATPDLREQLELFQVLTAKKFNYLPDGIFLTHAHIGHYTGLMQFGREVMNTKDLPVYVLPKMAQFLRTNGPWSQLDSLKNISIKEMKEDSVISPAAGFRIQAWTVPHRDEYSETAGFSFRFDTTEVLFIPDIDKWEKWDKEIVHAVHSHDFAFVDATFYDAGELPGRDIKTIPHPLVSETMSLFKNESAATRAKVFFIHFNHTNRLLWDEKEKAKVIKAGFRLAEQGMKVK